MTTDNGINGQAYAYIDGKAIPIKMVKLPEIEEASEYSSEKALTVQKEMVTLATKATETLGAAFRETYHKILCLCTEIGRLLVPTIQSADSKVVKLALYHKKARIRKKNRNRIIREFDKGVNKRRL